MPLTSDDDRSKELEERRKLDERSIPLPLAVTVVFLIVLIIVLGVYCLVRLIG